jgi:hypothetical protein
VSIDYSGELLTIPAKKE